MFLKINDIATERKNIVMRISLMVIVMARQKVMMPVDELGNIDFKFMNRYIALRNEKFSSNIKDILKGGE